MDNIYKAIYKNSFSTNDSDFTWTIKTDKLTSKTFNEFRSIYRQRWTDEESDMFTIIKNDTDVIYQEDTLNHWFNVFYHCCEFTVNYTGLFTRKEIESHFYGVYQTVTEMLEDIKDNREDYDRVSYKAYTKYA